MYACLYTLLEQALSNNALSASQLEKLTWWAARQLKRVRQRPLTKTRMSPLILPILQIRKTIPKTLPLKNVFGASFPRPKCFLALVAPKDPRVSEPSNVLEMM